MKRKLILVFLILWNPLYVYAEEKELLQERDLRILTETQLSTSQTLAAGIDEILEQMRKLDRRIGLVNEKLSAIEKRLHSMEETLRTKGCQGLLGGGVFGHLGGHAGGGLLRLNFPE